MATVGTANRLVDAGLAERDGTESEGGGGDGGHPLAQPKPG